jgi:hypothetical protein
VVVLTNKARHEELWDDAHAVADPVGGRDPQKLNRCTAVIRDTLDVIDAPMRLSPSSDGNHRYRKLDAGGNEVNDVLERDEDSRRRCRRAISWRVTSEHRAAPSTTVLVFDTTAEKPISHPLLHCLMTLSGQKDAGSRRPKSDSNTCQRRLGQSRHNNFAAKKQPCALIHNSTMAALGAAHTSFSPGTSADDVVSLRGRDVLNANGRSDKT